MDNVYKGVKHKFRQGFWLLSVASLFINFLTKLVAFGLSGLFVHIGPVVAHKLIRSHLFRFMVLSSFSTVACMFASSFNLFSIVLDA